MQRLNATHAASVLALAITTWSASAHADTANGTPPSQTLTVAGLLQPADILIDHNGVPHIFAANEEAPSLHEREPEAPADEPAFHPVLEEEPAYAPAAAEEGVPELAAAESVASEEAPPEVEAETGGPAVTRVSDLEREMARLLGEISGRRS